MREFGSEHPAVILPDGYFESFNELGHCSWLRSGREALYLVALSVKGEAEHPVILMPAYCCHSMVDPFLKAGWGVVYYPLLEDLTVDVQILYMNLVSKQPKAVLTMNYFGSASTKPAIDCIKTTNPNCICIEDFSHCTFSLHNIFNKEIDYYVSSIRKSVGVCDGSVVISKNALNETVIKEEETDFSITRRGVQTLKERYAYTHDPSSKNTFLIQLRQQEAALDSFEGVHRVSTKAQEQLKTIDGEGIAYARRKNLDHLHKLLKGKVNTISGIERCLNGAPFSYPILVDNRDQVQKNLAAKGVYAPVLWPISDDARATCINSAKMADQMLSIPIDQRYDYDDIEDIAKIIIDTV